MISEIERNPGSYRDARGYVFHRGCEIFRTIRPNAKLDYEYLRDNSIISKSIENGYLVETQELQDINVSEVFKDSSYVVRHASIPFVSYPYEWSFCQLKTAALHHLDFQIFLLDHNTILRDASAYNIQFIGTAPIFIDLLSLAPYKNGDYWIGHRQFCEQFLNPLLLRALKGVAHNYWYRGAIEGISTKDIARLISITDSLSWNVFTQVLLQAQLEKNNIANPDLAAYKAKKAKPLPKSAYRMLLIQFRNWISKLEPKDKDKTVWEEYAQSNTYNIDETSTKRNIVQQFVRKYKPKHIVDIGCNIGYYSHSALEAGAEYVIGYDSDINAIELAFKRAQLQKIPFLPLYLDATNPSPSQGWLQSERQGFDQRNRVDMVIALAFEHHLAIGKNIPLDQVIGWITSIAPKGLIEFVPKSDKTIGQLLALKEDMFDDYSEDRFTKVLSSHASIVGKTKVSASGRVIYEYIDRLSKCASY